MYLKGFCNGSQVFVVDLDDLEPTSYSRGSNEANVLCQLQTGRPCCHGPGASVNEMS